MLLILILSFLASSWLVDGCKSWPNEQNVALNAAVCQSSVYSGGNPKRAVNGDRNTLYSAGSCTHTGHDNPAWWRVDLKKWYKISRINIITRHDCCAERLLGAQIRIGHFAQYSRNKVCATVDNVSEESYCCYGMIGRYVSIVIPERSEYLSLCEVEVFGVPFTDDD